MTIPAECNNLIKYVSYNAQQDCVAVATDSGVRVYNCNPLTEVVTLSEGKLLRLLCQVGSIRIAQVLHRSNIIALVSGGRRPKYASNTLMLWDEARKRCVAECAVQGGPILNVFINTTRLVLVQSNRIHIFGLQPLHFLCAVDTGSNPSGLGAMGGDGPSAVLAFPSFKKGTVQLVAMDKVTPSADKKSLPPCVLTAHVGDIAVLAVNAQGTMLASGSTKGTIIRIFDTRTRLPLNELRRGTDPATLHCLAFSPCGTYLASSSDKSTVHIFNTRERNEDYGWSMRSMRNFYEEGKRSCAQFSLPDDTVAKLGFVAEEMEEGSKGTASQMSVVAVCSNGTFHRFSFNKEGLCERRAFDHILQLGSESDFWTAPF